MKFYLKFPDLELGIEMPPIPRRKLFTLYEVAAFGIYAYIVRAVAEQTGAYGLLWLFSLTLAMAGLWAWTNKKGGSA